MGKNSPMGFKRKILLALGVAIAIVAMLYTGAFVNFPV